MEKGKVVSSKVYVMKNYWRTPAMNFWWLQVVQVCLGCVVFMVAVTLRGFLTYAGNSTRVVLLPVLNLFIWSF